MPGTLRRLRRPAFTWVALAALASQVACAAPAPQAPPSLPAVVPDLGIVGVEAASAAPQFTLLLPARGARGGAARGAALGAERTAQASLAVLASAAPADPVVASVVLVAAVAVLALTPLGAAVGAVLGAGMAEPAERVDQAEAAVRSALAALEVPATLRDRVLEAGPRLTARRFAPVEGTRPPDLGSVLELRVPAVAFTGRRAIDPELEFHMKVEARLVRLADGEVLGTLARTYWSQRRRLAEWGRDDAAAFRREFDRATATLAEALVEELFLVYLPPGRPASRPASR